MNREAFLALLERALASAGIPARRWTVAPGLEDLEVSVDGVTRRLRVVRTAPTGTGRAAAADNGAAAGD